MKIEQIRELELEVASLKRQKKNLLLKCESISAKNKHQKFSIEILEIKNKSALSMITRLDTQVSQLSGYSYFQDMQSSILRRDPIDYDEAESLISDDMRRVLMQKNKKKFGVF